MSLEHGLGLLREALNGPEPEPDPVDQLVALAKSFGGGVDIAKNVDATETAVQGSPGRATVEHRSGCPRGGSDPCGADVYGSCSKCGAQVRDHEVIGKTSGSIAERGALVHKALDLMLSNLPERRREEPPGLHHTSESEHRCSSCEFLGGGGTCRRYNWPVDPDEVCDSWVAANHLDRRPAPVAHGLSSRG